MADQSTDYDRALIDPGAVYASPASILDDATLSSAQKLQLLRHWEADARELEVAEEEGMMNGEPDRLSDVLLAIEKLTADDAKHRDAPTKQGGGH